MTEGPTETCRGPWTRDVHPSLDGRPVLVGDRLIGPGPDGPDPVKFTVASIVWDSVDYMGDGQPCGWTFTATDNEFEWPLRDCERAGSGAVAVPTEGAGEADDIDVFNAVVMADKNLRKYGHADGPEAAALAADDAEIERYRLTTMCQPCDGDGDCPVCGGEEGGCEACAFTLRCRYCRGSGECPPRAAVSSDDLRSQIEKLRLAAKRMDAAAAARNAADPDDTDPEGRASGGQMYGGMLALVLAIEPHAAASGDREATDEEPGT